MRASTWALEGMIDVLDGKVAIITGASSGIGEAAARLFHAHGARVVLAGRSGAHRGLAQELGAGAIPCDVDVSRADQVRAMVDLAVDAFGGLDIVCNVAGIAGAMSAITDTSDEDFDRLIDTNLRGVFLTMKYAIPRMSARGGGAIVNVASTAALIGVPMLATYSASKAGVVALTKSVAADYARQGIRANVICPGVIDTPMHQVGVRANPTVSEYLEDIIPMGRIGRADEVARAMLFFASDQSSYATGAVLPLDGGQTLV